MPHRFADGFRPDNGARGKIPVTWNEWEQVGIHTDLRAYKLMEYLYELFYSPKKYSAGIPLIQELRASMNSVLQIEIT